MIPALLVLDPPVAVARSFFPHKKYSLTDRGMGNCQAVDAATLVIQHPNGKQQETMHWPVTASEVMRMNPGHYVSLIIPLPEDNTNLRFTQVKLLRPSDTLVLGQAYRLVTTQEVIKVLRAKKHAKMRKNQSQCSAQMNSEDPSGSQAGNYPTLDSIDQGTRHHRRSGSANFASVRFNSWRPSLQSILETGS